MADQAITSRTRPACHPVATPGAHHTHPGLHLVTLLATVAMAVPFALAASGTPASASSFTTSAKRAIIRAGPLPRLGRLAVTRRALPDAVLHQAYSFQFHVRDTRARVSWAAIGSLPPGLSLNPGTGMLSGVPAMAGSSAVLVSAYTPGRHRAVGYADEVLTVERPAITNVAVQRAGIVPGSRPVVRIWGSGFGVAPSVRGRRPGCLTRTGTLPRTAGLVVRDLSRSRTYGTGPGCGPLVIESWTDHQIVAELGSGRGTAPVVAAGDRLGVLADGARWAGKITASPAGGQRAVLAVPARALKVSAGVPYRVTLAAAGGGLADSWSIVAGRLPTGLTLDSSSGVISGTPRSAGTAVLTVQAAGPGASAARSRIAIAVSDQVTVPEQTVAASLYQGLYFGQLGSAPELENLLLADVATDTYASNPAANPTTVESELAALKTAFDTATNSLVSGTGTGLASFGPNLVAQLTGALGIMTSFAGSSQATVIGGGTLAAAGSIYSTYLQSNLANAIGYGQGYAGFSDRTVYDSGDVAGSAFHAIVSAPVIAQAVSCGQSSAACATVIDSLLKPVTNVSVAATPAQMLAANSSLGSMLQALGLTVASDGTLTTTAASYDSALHIASTQAANTAQTESTDDQTLTTDTQDPASPANPSKTAADSAAFITATAPQLTQTVTSSAFLAGLGNTVDPQNASSSDDTLLSGASIAQGTGLLLQALGANDAQQDTEIGDTIATFFDICTGNFADAIKNVFGLLAASSPPPDETFQLAQQLENTITTVYNDLSQQIKEVQLGVNAIKAQLGNLYQTIINDFGFVNFQLDQVNSALSSAILQLNQLQYSVDITDFDLLNISAADVNGTIQGHFNACLDYASRFPGQPGLTASAYETCEGEFKTDATSQGVASNPAVEYVVPGPYTNASVASQLKPPYDLPSNLGYLLSVLNSWYGTPAPPANLVNPDVWAEAALGYRELLDENPGYSAGPEPDLAAVELPGQQAAAAIRALQTVQGGKDPVLTDLGQNYTNTLPTLVTDINANASTFPTQDQYPQYGNWKGYSVSDPLGPEQTPAGGTGNVDPKQQISSIPACGTQAAVLTFAPTAWEPAVKLPNSWYLLAALGQKVTSGFSLTTTPVCVASFTVKTHVQCVKGNCEIIDVQTGTLDVQFEGTDGAVHTLGTLATAAISCVQGSTGCGQSPTYFADLLEEAGSVQQLLTNSGGLSMSADTSVLDSEGDQILAKEQLEVYQWDADCLTTSGLGDNSTLSGDMNALAGAFDLFQATTQTIAPSAALGNQALSDILYGQDQVASSTDAPNSPVLALQALAGGGTTTLTDWENTQNSRLTLAQTLLNGYLSSAASSGTLATAEAPDLIYSVLAQLNTGLQIGLSYKAPAITSAASATFTTGKAGSFQVTATGHPAPTFTETGTLPAGVTFTSAGLLSGTPAPRSSTSPGSGGAYPLTITASNGIGTAATQSFTLTVNQPPAIKAPGSVTYSRGQQVKLTVHSSGYPVPKLTWTGKLPAGLKAKVGTGKLTITGTVSTTATTGKYPIKVTATNAAGKATKTITITVKT